MMNKNPTNAKKIIVNGIIYDSIKQASDIIKISVYKIKKLGTFIDS